MSRKKLRWFLRLSYLNISLLHHHHYRLKAEPRVSCFSHLLLIFPFTLISQWNQTIARAKKLLLSRASYVRGRACTTRRLIWNQFLRPQQNNSHEGIKSPWLPCIIHMFSKSGNLKMAEDTCKEMKLHGKSLERRFYGSMIVAYVRAKMLNEQKFTQGTNKFMLKSSLQSIALGLSDDWWLNRSWNHSIPDVKLKLCVPLINAYEYRIYLQVKVVRHVLKVKTWKGWS